MITRGNIVNIDGLNKRLNGRLFIPEGSEVKGAPLYGEFLQKNGWKKDENIYRFGNEFTGATITQVLDQWSLKIDNGVWSFSGWIRYIHELQNIMEMCGLQDTWKL